MLKMDPEDLLALKVVLRCCTRFAKIAQRSSTAMIRIGLYSEDRKLQPLLSSALGSEFDVVWGANELEINHLLADGSCDVVLLDLDSNQTSSQERLECSRRIVASQVPLVIMADDGRRSTAVELVQRGAYGYCRRPPSIRDLEAMLRRAHENSSLKQELQAAHHKLEAVTSCDQMIGSSPQMRQVYDLVRRVANINAPVLVTGESGTGKELIAKAIHNEGSRPDRPFVAVFCGAIPEPLIESELFGHEKGAFTGAVATRVGYMEQAGNGTLFLDEMGELSLATQVKLLRVLQEREFSRLGSNRIISLRARLIFATHQDLEEMVAQGKFRQDLYYRINVMKIEAPPLQEHPEDITPIAMHFLKVYATMYRKPIEDVEPGVMALLQGYAWPGNVRELENVIQRAIILAHGERICAEDLPRNIQEDTAVNIEDYQPAGSFERQLHNFKVKLAMTAVRENGGNKTLAALSLQISRAYLHRLIRIPDLDLLGEPHRLALPDSFAEPDMSHAGIG
jgi:DNA-binding NtrC family response regulator